MRPRLHFTAETGWINDPHGLTFRDGEYHLFHQYVPDSMVWAPGCHWGHAIGTDLVTWTPCGVAIAPGDGDDGIWTGSLVRHGDEARILYTSVTQPDLGLGRVRVASPLDDTWTEWAKGEIVLCPPEDLDLIAYRDPFVVREGDEWRMFIGAATRAGEALALTYTSPDLTGWRYDGVALGRSTIETDPVWMGALWECPQVFEVEGHWVMVSSVWDADVLHYAAYAIGDGDSYGHGRFTPTDWARLSFGDSYYAPSFFRDRDGRPCLMFWMRGVNDPQQGWAGCLSVAHVLSVRDGRLVATPHPDVTAARRLPLAAGERAGAFDVEWTPAPDGDRLVLTSDDAHTGCLTAADGLLTFGRPGREGWSMPWSGEPVRVVVDGPVLEAAAGRGLLGGPIDVTNGWQQPRGHCAAWRLEPREAVSQ